MHREQHNESKSKKWLWIILIIAVIVLVGISAYLAGQLSSVKKEASSAKSAESSKVISSSSDSDTNNDEDTNNDMDNTNEGADTTDIKAEKDDSTESDGDIGRIPSLDVSTVCACLLVAPDWFKSNDVSFQEVNSNDGIIKDDKGNFVETNLNHQNNVTITYCQDDNGQQVNKSIDVPLKQLYVDYYNTQKKRDEVNYYVNNLN